MRKLYTPWLIQCGNDILKNSTKSGYLKAPKTEILLNWLKESAKNIKTEHIFTSFDSTGITCTEKTKHVMEKLKINIVDVINR